MVNSLCDACLCFRMRSWHRCLNTLTSARSVLGALKSPVIWFVTSESTLERNPSHVTSVENRSLWNLLYSHISKLTKDVRNYMYSTIFEYKILRVSFCFWMLVSYGPKYAISNILKLKPTENSLYVNTCTLWMWTHITFLTFCLSNEDLLSWSCKSWQ